MSLKVFHFSDTHLGYAEFDKISPSAVNQREEDCYRVFQEAIEKAIELKVDLVLHSGDFFHRPWPSNRSLIEALSGLKKLSLKKIPTVIIAGNHSTPRTIYTSPILKTLTTLDNIYPVFQEKYEKIFFPDTVVHAIPYVNEENKFFGEIKNLKPETGKLNILMLHTSLGKDYILEDYGERILPKDYFSYLKEFDYLALGHFHNLQQVKELKNAWYCGSTERLSEKEARHSKVALLIEFQEPTKLLINEIPLAARPWFVLNINDCSQKTIAEIKNELETFNSKNNLNGAIITIHLNDLKPIQSIELTNQELTKLFPQALIVLSRRQFEKDNFTFKPDTLFQENLKQIFNSYLGENISDKTEREKLLAEANIFFKKIEDQFS